MSRHFPHLTDTAFPNLETVTPYERKTDFDYSRYDYEATIKLCNVTWPYDYSHVVYWTGAKMRDAYFDGIQGRTVELGQGFTRTQQDRIVISVPYDVCLTYSYVYMQVPILTEDEPIDHETASGIRTVCAFISDVIYQAPSSTLLVLDVDWWTTYLPHLSVTSMMLARGHAPMWDVPADEYLDNPRAMCRRLLTPDVDFGPDASMVRAGEVMPLSVAEPVLIMASTIPYASIATIPTTGTGSSTAPTYYDTGARNGEQVGVNGFVWAPEGKTYAGMTSPSTATRIEDEMLTGLYYYAMPGSDVTAGVLDTLFAALPAFAASIQAAYIVPSDLVTLGTTVTVAGIELSRVYSKGGYRDLGTYQIRKDDFGYPAKYADIAKLYTWPYAHVTVSDDAGASLDVRIEDTSGTISTAQMVSIAWPMLTWDVALTNVASTGGSATYTWAQITGGSYERHVPNADMARALISYEIPTFALYLDASTEAGMLAQAGTERSRHDAIVAYQSTMRSANTAEHNAYDSNATAKANADASADAAKANADASADTSVTNTYNTGATQTANTNLNNALRTAEAALQNAASNDLEDTSTRTMGATVGADIAYSRAAADAQLKGEAITGITNMVGAALDGNAFGAVSAGIGTLVAMGTKQAMTELAADNSKAKMSANIDQIEDSSAVGRDVATTGAIARNNNATNVTSNSVSNANTNAANSAATAKNNATRTQGAAKGNAARSQGTGNANANFSRDTTEENAKAQLENTQADYLDDLRRYDVMAPNAHGSYSGTGIHEQMRSRGLHFRIVTQDDSSISRAGDAFLRYGYRYDGQWNVRSWCPSGSRYCYWQSSDIVQDMTAQPNVMASRSIRAILEQGITVWADPKEVGRW